MLTGGIMKNKKTAIMATSLVFFLAGLTACGGTTDVTTSEPASSPTTEQTTIPTTAPTTENTDILVPSKDQTNLSDIAAVNDDTSVFVRGVVYSKARQGRQGYWIADLTGCAFVYEDCDSFNYGDVVEIYGTKSSYFGLPQIKYGRNPGENIGNTTYRPKYSKATIREFYDFETAPDVSNFGRNITVEGKVISKLEEFMTNWYIQDPVTGEEFKVDYQSGENYVGVHKDKFVEIDLTTYNFNTASGVWSVFVDGTNPRIEEKEAPTLTTDEKLESIKIQLIKKYNNFKAYRDVKLMTTDDLFGSTITYVSNNPGVLSNEGKVTVPAETTMVLLTASISVDGKSVTVALNVEVQNLIVESLATVMSSFETKLSANATYSQKVATTGYITATRGGTGYWIQDGEYALYVKGNTEGFVKGQTVNVFGLLKYKNQPIIDKPDYQEISSKAIAEPDIKETTVSQLVSNGQFNVKSYSSYISIRGKLIGSPGSYGYTYKIADLQDESKTILVHSASNVVGFTTIDGKVATFKCFVQDYNNGFRIFTTNREGELLTEATDEENINIEKEYLGKLMPTDGETLSTDIDLPTSNIILPGVSLSWVSSNEKAIDSKGVYKNPTSEENVKFTCTLSSNKTTATLEYNYKVAPSKGEGHANDLMFTTLMRGAKNDKIVSITNTTGKDVSLKDYKVYSVQNSGIGSNSFDINGTNAQGKLGFEATDILKNNETMILYHAQAENTLISNIPSTVRKISCPNQNGVVAFNGGDGDALYLLRNTSIVDKVGTFEKVLSQGQPTSWEERYFSSNSMIVRKVNNPTPILDWTNFEETDKVYERMVAVGAANKYEIPEFMYNWASIL